MYFPPPKPFSPDTLTVMFNVTKHNPRNLKKQNPPKNTKLKTKTNMQKIKNAKTTSNEKKKSIKILLISFCLGQLLLGMGPALECG